MLLNFLKSKIHRATVTEANLNYIGSISIERLVTYAIKAPAGSGEICINGAAAHLVKKDDLVIIVAYCMLEESFKVKHKATIVHVDAHNKII